jgi:urease beta subunit
MTKAAKSDKEISFERQKKKGKRLSIAALSHKNY